MRNSERVNVFPQANKFNYYTKTFNVTHLNMHDKTLKIVTFKAILKL